MNEPEWLDIDIVLDFHAEQLALFGGADGVRDRGLLNPHWRDRAISSLMAKPISPLSLPLIDWDRAQPSFR